MNAIFEFTYLAKIKGIPSEEIIVNTRHNGLFVSFEIKQNGHIECQSKLDYDILLRNISEYMTGFEPIKLVIIDNPPRAVNFDANNISFKK